MEGENPNQDTNSQEKLIHVAMGKIAMISTDRPDRYQAISDEVSKWNDDQNKYLDIVRQKLDTSALIEELKRYDTQNRITKDGLEAIGCLVARLGTRLLDYDTLVSDEGGGRIPTLILREIAKIKNEASGSHAPNTIFLTGGRVGDAGVDTRDWKHGVERYLFLRQQNPEQKINKALLVSEAALRDGSSLAAMMKRFSNSKISIDLAVISAASVRSLVETVALYGETYIGSKSEIGASMFLGGEQRTGVSKKTDYLPEDAPRPIVHPQKIKNFNVEDIQKERQIAKIIATAMAPLI